MLSHQPEIFSITPSELSFYGKNNAVLTGRNLGHVIGVRLQGDLDCSAKEASVRLNTGASLTFHIPAGDKGRVEVCLLLPDGSCHGNASLTYLSAPVCASISPDSTWASGKRKMNISGSNLEFVEEVTHSHTNQKVTFSKTGDGASLKFESLATDRDPFSSSVTLRITYGAKTVLLEPHRYFMVFLIRLIIVILVGLTMWGCIYYYRPRLAAQMNMSTGDLEIYLWADIRQGCANRQTPRMLRAKKRKMLRRQQEARLAWFHEVEPGGGRRRQHCHHRRPSAASRPLSQPTAAQPRQPKSPRSRRETGKTPLPLERVDLPRAGPDPPRSYQRSPDVPPKPPPPRKPCN
ncbi:unnamed protein product [Gadus morhua 'NCC']